MLGIFWYIIVEIEYQTIDNENEENFFILYELDKKLAYESCIALTYFSLTSLSTIGLGDYHPKNSFERILVSIILLSGVSMFSYFMGNLLELIENYNKFTADYEEEENLHRFFSLIQKFNLGQPMKKEKAQEIYDFIRHYWEYNKMLCLSSESDMRMFDELPYEIKNSLFQKFLYKRFLGRFTKLFDLPKNDQVKHSYYKFSHEEYSSFMIDLFKKLEPRMIKSNQIVIDEMEQVDEIIFVESGSFMVGYNLQGGERKFKGYFPMGNTIGAFYCAFRLNSEFVFKVRH